MSKLGSLAAVLGVVAIGAVAYAAWSRMDNDKKIAELTDQLASMTAQREEIEGRVKAINEENERLKGQVGEKETQVKTHLAEVDKLKTELVIAHESAFTTSQPEEYKVKIAAFYPAMAGSDWEVLQTTSASGRKRNYLKVPLGMADTFMFQQTRADSLEEQMKELTIVVELQTEISGLKDQINALTEAKATAYMEGYDKAYAAYVAANKDLVDVLKQPSFKLEVPKAGALLACSLIGLALGAGL